MADAAAVTLLDVYRVDPDSGVETGVGLLELAADGTLAVLEAAPDVAIKLTSAVSSMNAKRHVTELVPPEDATEPGQTAAKITERTDPDFVQALNRYMRRYYGFGLG